MPVDRHIVGRVGEDELGLFFRQEPFEDGGVPGIATEESVFSEPPEIAQLRDAWLVRRKWRDGIRGVGGMPLFAAIDKEVDLGGVEAG